MNEWAEYIRIVAVKEPIAMFVLIATGALFLVLVIAMRDEWGKTLDAADA